MYILYDTMKEYVKARSVSLIIFGHNHCQICLYKLDSVSQNKKSKFGHLKLNVDVANFCFRSTDMVPALTLASFLIVLFGSFSF